MYTVLPYILELSHTSVIQYVLMYRLAGVRYYLAGNTCTYLLCFAHFRGNQTNQSKRQERTILCSTVGTRTYVPWYGTWYRGSKKKNVSLCVCRLSASNLCLLSVGTVGQYVQYCTVRPVVSIRRVVRIHLFSPRTLKQTNKLVCCCFYPIVPVL
jgi:hypothetical protein